MLLEFAAFQFNPSNLLIYSFIWKQKASQIKMSQMYWYIRGDYLALQLHAACSRNIFPSFKTMAQN